MLKAYKDIKKTDIVKEVYGGECVVRLTNLHLEPTEKEGTYKMIADYCKPYAGICEGYVNDYSHNGFENYQFEVVGTM